MKKILALILILILSVPALALATEINIGGEFEVTGIYRESMTNFDNSADDTSKTWYENLVLSMEAKVADNITLFATATISDRSWGDAAANHPIEQATDDVAYAEIVLNKHVANVGRQLNEWGHMLMTDGDGVDRLQVSRPIGDGGMSLGINVDKIIELDAANAGSDDDRYGIFFTREDGDMQYGAYIARTVSGSAAVGPDVTGTEVDIYFTGKIAGMDSTAEIALQAGDLFEDAAGNNPMALFVTIEKELSGMNVSGTFALASNGYVASAYFNPTFLVGTDQDTSYDEFSAPADDTATLIAIGADKAMGDKWTVGGKVALWVIADDGDMSAAELDLMAEYQIAENATWGLYAAFMAPDGLSAQDDSAFAVLNSLAFEF